MSTFTYTGSNSNLDMIRTLLGDTDGDTFLFSNEEINLLLSRNSNNVDRTCADCCRAVAMSVAKQAVIVKLLDTSVDRSEIPRIYLSLAKQFEAQERSTPIEYQDSFAYSVDPFGVDKSEYVNEK